jgi:hypothetical protein
MYTNKKTIANSPYEEINFAADPQYEAPRNLGDRTASAF